MPRVLSPARPNTPPANQKNRRSNLFTPTDNNQTHPQNTPTFSIQTAPVPPQQSATVLPPRTCAECGNYHAGTCSAPSIVSSSQKTTSALEIYDRYKANYQPEDRIQPFEIMYSITGDSLKFSSTMATDAELLKIGGKKFTLRHYTTSKQSPPPFTTIASNFELVHRKIKTLNRTIGSHTNQDDWVRLGNTAFTFFILAIDGKVANRKFLTGATHYAEIDPNDREQMAATGLEHADFFASQDLLHIKDLSTTKAIKGPLKNFTSLMLASSGLSPVALSRTPAERLLKAIDDQFSGTLEVKIAGSVKIAQWHNI